MKKVKRSTYSPLSATALAAIPLLLQGCGSSPSSSSPSSSITNLESGITSAQSNLQKVPQIKDTNPTAFDWAPRLYREVRRSLFPEAIASSLGSLSAFWTNSGDAPDLYNGGSGYSGTGYESPQNWMGQELDPSFTNSNGAATTPFGRSAVDFMILCIFGEVQQQNPTLAASMDSDNLLKAGAYSITVDFSTASGSKFMGCNIPTTMQSGTYALKNMGTATLNLTVTAVSPNTTYTKKYVSSWSNNNIPSFTVFLKVDTANQILNMGEVEESHPGGSGWAIDRSLLSVNNDVTDFEYVEQSYHEGSTSNTVDGVEMYRFHIDTGNDVAYVFGNNGAVSDDVSVETYTRYALAGKPNDLNSIAGSMAITQIKTSTSSPTSQNAGAACVSNSTGAITTDASLNCDIAGVDISSTQVAEQTALNHEDMTDASYTQTYSLNASTKIPWTTYDTNTSTGMFGVPSP